MNTIYDIAEKVHVSIATVSRVMNNGPVKPQTREKILRTMERMAYVPDSRAVNLKKAKTKEIGLIVPDITNPVYPITVKVVHDLLRARDYHVLLGITYGEIAEEERILKMMEQERVAGIVVDTCEGPDDRALRPLFERLLNKNIPMVFMGKNPNDLPVDVFSTDNFAGALKMTDYLLRSGRRRIAFIAGRGDLRVTAERLGGYRESLRRKGFSASEDLIVCEGDYTLEHGRKWAALLIERARPDAIFCGNDLMAIGAMQAAEAMNVRVPDKVAIAGFDDIPFAAFVKPKLSTVRQLFEQVAARGCDRLLARINGAWHGLHEDIQVEPELIIRESA